MVFNLFHLKYSSNFEAGPLITPQLYELPLNMTKI